MWAAEDFRKDMLDYIKTQPCGVANAIQHLENAPTPVVRYVFCLCKDLERNDRKIKRLEDELKVYNPPFDYADYINYND